MVHVSRFPSFYLNLDLKLPQHWALKCTKNPISVQWLEYHHAKWAPRRDLFLEMEPQQKDTCYRRSWRLLRWCLGLQSDKCFSRSQLSRLDIVSLDAVKAHKCDKWSSDTSASWWFSLHFFDIVESYWRQDPYECLRQHRSSLEHARQAGRSVQGSKFSHLLLLELIRHFGCFWRRWNKCAYLEPEHNIKRAAVLIQSSWHNHGHSLVDGPTTCRSKWERNLPVVHRSAQASEAGLARSSEHCWKHQVGSERFLACFFSSGWLSDLSMVSKVSSTHSEPQWSLRSYSRFQME